MPRADDPVQRQLAATRRGQILDAAAAVFADKGFHQATVRDVARAAGVADGTIYLYFTGKADLLIGLLDRLNESEQRPEHLAAIGAEGDLRAVLAVYLRHRLALMWPNVQVFRAVLPELLANPELRARYFDAVLAPTLALAERTLAAAADAGHIRRTDPALTARAIPATVLGLLVLQLLGDEQVAARWEELPELLAGLIYEGLRPVHDAPTDAAKDPAADPAAGESEA